MKYALMFVFAFSLIFTKVAAQTPTNGLPWDLSFKIPKEETRTIKGEKGKIIAVTYWKMENFAGLIPQYAFRLMKKDAQTGEKLEISILVTASGTTNHLFVLRENEELIIEARSSLLAYFSGYIYDAK